MKTYRIRPLPLISYENDMSVFTYRFNYGKRFEMPVYCWYIEGTDQHILVDTGADVETTLKFRGVAAKEIATFDQALAGLGLRPEDIDIVIQTHLQWDHCVHTSRCKNARVIAAERELTFALAPHPILAPTYKKDLLRDLHFTLVKGHYEVAPGIEIIPAPGHSPGTQAVSINTEQGKAVITGFCCIRQNFEPPEEVRDFLPVIAPGIHLDAVEAFETALRIKHLADIVIPMHDPAYLNVQSIP